MDLFTEKPSVLNSMEPIFAARLRPWTSPGMELHREGTPVFLRASLQNNGPGPAWKTYAWGCYWLQLLDNHI